MLETFTVATFAEHLGERFPISPDPARSIAVELDERRSAQNLHSNL